MADPRNYLGKKPPRYKKLKPFPRPKGGRRDPESGLVVPTARAVARAVGIPRIRKP